MLLINIVYGKSILIDSLGHENINKNQHENANSSNFGEPPLQDRKHPTGRNKGIGETMI